jgi:hypothetical protein
MERHHHILLVAKLAEPDPQMFFAFHGGQLKIRRAIPHLQRHRTPLSALDANPVILLLTIASASLYAQ